MTRFFRFNFQTAKFSIKGGRNSATGFICTAYYKNKPIFNLVMDEGAESRSPRNFMHDWFGKKIRWGVP